MHFPVELKEKYEKIAAAIGLKPEDVEERFAGGGGHGGQKINKSQNCVELHHIPSKTIVRYQHHRGLHRNRVEAWQLLILKVQEHVIGDASELSRKHHKIEKQKQRRSRRTKQKMLAEKHDRSDIKASRRKIELSEGPT